MVEENSDRFQNEVLRSLQKLVAKAIEHDESFDSLESQIERVSDVLKNLKSDVNILTGQFNDVDVMAIKDHNRIDKLEKRVNDFEAGVH